MKVATASGADAPWLAAIVDASDDAIIGTTLDGVVVSWNSGAERLHGYTAAEVVGRPVTMLAPPERSDEVRAILERLARGERVDHYETVRLRRDGTRVEVSITVSPVRLAQRVVGYSTIARDVTARRRADDILAQSARRCSALFRANPAPVLLCTMEGDILDASEALLERTGFTRAELIGAPMRTLRIMSPQDHRGEVIEALRRQGAIRDVPMQIRTPGGEVLDWVVSAAMVSIGDETLVVAAATDVGSLHSAERLLQSSLAQLRLVSSDRARLIRRLVEAQEAERRRIAGDIHDDSLQVLGALNIGLHRLRVRLSEPGAASLAGELEETVQLAMARLRELLFDLHPVVLDRDGIVPALRASLDLLSEDTGIIATLAADPPLPEPDPEQRIVLYRIVQEALANVRKHAHADRVEVSITEEGGRLVISVRDDGVGFVPGDTMRPDSLGLISMRERVEMLDGGLDVETAPGRGTTVRIRSGPVPAGR